MSDMQNALIRLNDAIEKMDSAARATQIKFSKLEQKISSAQVPQRDLFAVSGVMNGTTGQVEYTSYDPAMLARKLDLAIEKVEQVLKEG
jgi:hypothetical protein